MRAYELYFERLEKAGLLDVKRPDLLIFRHTKREYIEKFVQDMGGRSELPFLPESSLKGLLEEAIVAIECENSLWKANA